MSIYRIAPISLAGVHTYPLARRPGKVTVREFARPHRSGGGMRGWLESLPRILAAESFRAVVRAVSRAGRRGRPVLWGIGGHVIKVGLAPVLIDLMRRGWVAGVAMNGAALVHDFEIAMVGRTSEDVPEVLGSGKFGMAQETGLYLNEAAVGAARSGMGLGEAAGKLLSNRRLRAKYPEQSVLVAAYRAGIPVTVHVAMGTDTPHMHPSADGASLGAATHHDFRLFCALVKGMHPGGVYLNWGSAVILPEIFLKAVSVVRNLGTKLAPITTANFDFLQHYRPMENVVRRPTTGPGSRGYAITGHHELLLPLLAAALVETGGRPRGKPRRKP
ncbi:MAG TPA: hypothetical protein VLW54_14380 [Candidatus Acidoferrales bacterium]|nr:hypothetical protein [Candidatus Acidoferrales bacterium]